MEQKKLLDRVIWITGASRGLGRAMALALAAEGAKVIVSARDLTTIQKVAQEIADEKGQAFAIPCDVQNSDEINYLVATVKQTWGAIDILINNAGIGIFHKIIDTTETEWDALMATNLRGAFLCTKAVLSEMIARKSGHIINVVSVAGKQAYYNCGGYCASKFGLYGFTEVLRQETRKYGIHVTALLPGATDTAIWSEANVDHTLMMDTTDVAKIVVSICAFNEKAMIEEVVLRPIKGDLP